MRLRLLGGALTLLVVSLVSTAPAWLLGALSNRFAPGSLSVQQAQGSLWRGSAQLQARVPPAGMLDLGEVSWRVQLLALMTGKLRGQLDAPKLAQGGSLSGTVSIGLDRVPQLQNVRAQLPAQTLSQFVAQLRMLQPQGDVDIASTALTLQQPLPAGDFLMTWRGFSTRMSKVNPLGDYKLEAQLAAGSVKFKLSSPAGPLLLDGNGTWSPTARLSFDGTARLAPNAPPQLGELVRLFGREQAPGTYALSIRNF